MLDIEFILSKTEVKYLAVNCKVQVFQELKINSPLSAHLHITSMTENNQNLTR